MESFCCGLGTFYLGRHFEKNVGLQVFCISGILLGNLCLAKGSHGGTGAFEPTCPSQITIKGAKA